MAAQWLLIAVLATSFGPFAVMAQGNFSDVDFCNATLCKVYQGNGTYMQEPNIACNNSGNLSSSCPSSVQIEDVTNFTDLILHLHNDKRNVIALGQIVNMDPAVRMATVKWDPTLQYLAELNCKRCYYGHDKCRNSPSFPYAGQNIGITRSYPNPKTNEQVINQIFNDWFKEHKHASMGSITNFTGSHGATIGHFTQVVQDNSIEIGCGLIKWQEYKGSKLENAAYFVCNYAVGNIDDFPIYVPGATASQCQTGNNPNYTGLCSVNEVISTTTL